MCSSDLVETTTGPLGQGIANAVGMAAALKFLGARYDRPGFTLFDGHVWALCGDGDLALVHALPDRHVEIARIPGIKGKTWNHPAIANNKLYVRNSDEMACYDLGGA